MNTSPKAPLVGLLFFLWTQFGEIKPQCLSRSDACFPPVPCEHGEKVSNPSDCESYQVCLAPYEWVIDASDCEGEGWHFSNSSCTCLTSNACVDPWECPVGTSVPPRASAPCFLEPKECTSTINGYYVPDAYYCSKYFECDQGIEDWVSMTCPPGEYFDETLLFLPQPCRADIGACERIAFDQCFPYTGPTTTTILITTTMPTTTVPTTSAYTCPLEPDACYPHMPCTTKNRVSNPEDCGSFLQCAAPYEWCLIEDECGGSYGSFSNQTCSCSINNECDTWECGPPTGTIPPPLGTGPCFLDPETTCQTAYQTLPDRNYCTKYYECDDGEWISKSCPSADAPYYDMTIPFVNPPCRYDINKCDLIPFDECLPVTTPPPV